MPEELKIAMFGARGVGKTSLLTAIYEQFDQTIGKTGLQLIPDLESDSILQERLGELKALLDNFEATGGIDNTSEPRSFIFDLGRKGGQASLRLNFQDFPGGWLTSNATSEQRESVQKLLKESVAILIAIDAPALMEKKGKWHDLINRPKQIKNQFARVYQEMNSRRLVIFAPIRCEKYMQNPKDAETLLNNVKEGYADLLDLFGTENLKPWIASVVTPVQTVGTVVFSKIEVKENAPHFYFRKMSHDAEYKPLDSDQPLRYLLRFILKLSLDKQSSGLIGFLLELFGMNEYLKREIIKSSEGCKTTQGFAVLQGQKWLQIKGE